MPGTIQELLKTPIVKKYDDEHSKEVDIINPGLARDFSVAFEESYRTRNSG